MKTKRHKAQHELVVFLALWADRYQRDYGLDGLHPTHYDLMEKYGARMNSFKRATNAVVASAQETEK
jgi:hypothetical protein